MAKFTIYQLIPRLFTNYNSNRKHNGSIEENGCGKFNFITDKSLREIKKLGITHVWYTGIIEHATKTNYSEFGILPDYPEIVKGQAGSPYAIKDYYDVCPDLAEDVPKRMEEFDALVERTHKNGLKVIIDFVPNHVARVYYSDSKPKNVRVFGENDDKSLRFSPQNNFYYLVNENFNPQFNLGKYEEFPAKVSGNDCFHPSPNSNDWYETIKLNYGVDYERGGEKHFSPTPDTWLKMRQILFFWADKKIDGFRCDMAEMVPVEFWAWIIPQIKKKYPELIFIAEVYNPAEYHNYIANGKFDYLYDKVGLYEKLRGITSKNHAARDITYCWQSLNTIQDKMLNFLENHDEQRIASGFFAGDGMYAKPAMVVAATLTKAPVMIYFGQELGELGMDSEGFSGMDGRTSIFDYWGLKSIQAWANGGKFDGKELSEEQKELRDFYSKLLNITLKEKAITEGIMYDLEYVNLNNPAFNTHELFSYFRKYKDNLLLFVLNFHDKTLDTQVRLSQEVFQFLEIEENQNYEYKDLLDDSDEIKTTQLSYERTLDTQMPPWTAKIFKFKSTK
jgi:Glycosidases